MFFFCCVYVDACPWPAGQSEQINIRGDIGCVPVAGSSDNASADNAGTAAGMADSVGTVGNDGMGGSAGKKSYADT